MPPATRCSSLSGPSGGMPQPTLCVNAIDAIHVGKVACELRPAEAVFDVVRHRRRTIHAGNDGDVVARADSPVGAARSLGRCASAPVGAAHRPACELAQKCVIAAEFPAPRLCVWTWSPGSMSLSEADGFGRILRTGVAFGNVREIAILWPGWDVPRGGKSRSVPAQLRPCFQPLTTATLSASCKRRAKSWISFGISQLLIGAGIYFRCNDNENEIALVIAVGQGCIEPTWERRHPCRRFRTHAPARNASAPRRRSECSNP